MTLSTMKLPELPLLTLGRTVLLTLTVVLTACGGGGGDGGGGGGGAGAGGGAGSGIKMWGNAMSIDIGTFDADDPQIAMDAAGNAMAAWERDDGTGLGLEDIWANYYDAATGIWSTPTLIETNIGDAFDVQIAMDAAGNAIAVWEQEDISTSIDDIWANRYDAATSTWGTATLIDSNSHTVNDAQIAIDADGNAIAVWEQDDNAGVSNIVANLYAAATDTWGTAEPIETESGDAFDPQIAVDRDGNAIAVWEQDGIAGISNIYANRYAAISGTWGTAVRIETHTGDAFDPQITIDTDGNAIAVWEQDGNAGISNIRTNRYAAATGTWGTAEPIETNIGDAFDPRIAIDGDGNALVVWEQNDAVGVRDIWANRYADATGIWGTETLIETNVDDAFDPQIAMDAAGNAVAVWEQNDAGGLSHIWVNHYEEATATWGTATQIEANSGDADDPRIAMDAEGNALAVWEQDDGTGLSVDGVAANSYR